jgi:hypothetical protein
MTLYVSEYTNSVAGRYRQPSTPQSPVKSYALSTGGTSTGGVTPQAGTQFIRVSADVGMLLSLNLASTVAPTSTNAVRIPPNAAPEIFAVSTGFLIQTAST